MTGQELKQWRESRGFTQRDIAAKLDISDAAVNRWENGQDIPGPAQLLLEMLIYGKMPFSGIGPVGDPEREAKNFWQLQLTLDDWHRLESLATAAGYVDTKDYILSLIQEELNANRQSVITYPPAKEFLGSGADLPLAAEATSSGGGSQDTPQTNLRGAVEAFESENPPPGGGSSVQYSGSSLRGKRKRKPSPPGIQ